MKWCKKCDTTRHESEFAKNSRNKDGLQSYCKPCSNIMARKNYEDNKPRYFSVAKRRDAEMKARIRELKARPCTDCGVSYPWYVMEFDHLRDKEMDISKMMRRRMAWDKIEAELAKCELVCANCHRERSYLRWSA